MIQRETITQSEIDEVLRLHEMWLKEGSTTGKRADLTGADLSCVDLTGRDLRGARLVGANLTAAKLTKAILTDANLASADLRLADLTRAYLVGVNLAGANLRGASLVGVRLTTTNLAGVDLRETEWAGAYISNIDWTEVKNMPDIPMACPDTGSFIGWKKAWTIVHTEDEQGYGIKSFRREVIVKLLIPEDALRSSAIGRKCRCNKATVLAVETLLGEPFDGEAYSFFDCDFTYHVGATVEEPDFCTDRFKECAEGIHFFVNRQEAVNYEG